MFKPIAQVHIYLNIFKPSDVPYTIINFSLGNLKLHTQMTSIEQPGSFYKLQFECTYPTIEDETESNEVYRRELLAIFRTSQFDDEGINDSLDKLYIALKDNVVVAPLLVLSARMAESSDPMIGLIMLHSFDYLYLTHPLLSALLVDGQPDAASFPKFTYDKLRAIILTKLQHPGSTSDRLTTPNSDLDETSEIDDVHDL